MATATHTLNIVIQVMDKATAPMKGVEGSLNKVEKTAKRATNSMLGMGLGLTFFMFGVQIQLQRMLRSMFNVFKEAEGETGLLNQQFNIIRANLAAISIAFFDAFAQSGFFEVIISLLTTIANWFLNLTQAQRQLWTEGAIKALIFAKVISFAGQVLLALFIALQLVKLAAFPFILLAIVAVSLWAKGWGFVELAVLGVGIAFVLMAKRMIGISFLFFLMQSIWLLSFGGMFIMLALLISRFGSFGNAMKAWASAIALAIAFVVDFAVRGFLTLLQFAALGIIGLINLINKIPGVEIGTEGLDKFVLKDAPDIVGLVAQGLDKIGFNVQPVEKEPNLTLESLFTKFMGEDASLQEKLLEEQKKNNDLLAEQKALTEAVLSEDQAQTIGIGDVGQTLKKTEAKFNEAETKTIEDFTPSVGR